MGDLTKCNGTARFAHHRQSVHHMSKMWVRVALSLCTCCFSNQISSLKSQLLLVCIRPSRLLGWVAVRVLARAEVHTLPAEREIRRHEVAEYAVPAQVPTAVLTSCTLWPDSRFRILKNSESSAANFGALCRMGCFMYTTRSMIVHMVARRGAQCTQQHQNRKPRQVLYL